MIVVEIKIPVLRENFDFQLDETVPIKGLLEEISEIMCKKYKEGNSSGREFILANNERILNLETTLLQNNVREGDTLLLV